LGPEKSGRLKEEPHEKKFRLVVNESNWPLLTGGCCSEVVIKAGLPVFTICVL